MADNLIKTIGILSIGEMGLGIGQLLISHGYIVGTFAEDRSESTRERARLARIQLHKSMPEFVGQCDVILSIVPPRDAFATAKRVYDACAEATGSREKPLYYVDLNAVSPSLASTIDNLFQSNPDILFVDGGIIGGVPFAKDDGKFNDAGEPTWHCPSLIVSGPVELPSPTLCRVLNVTHLQHPIGSATGLKMCYASLTKGFFALAIESFVTADTMGILPELRETMQKYNPATLAMAERGIVTMPPKAYRWIHEMQEIGATFNENGGFETKLFEGVSEVYRIVAEDTELGMEQPGRRVQGKTVEDAIVLIRNGMKAKGTGRGTDIP
ncbi:6-phosphogluconate dehydrogenase [Biscogniauxia sp. FL1348]|nr:6-phosphogluconate dehydrogenase [Biscogniauxia sp. FL1348]